MDTDTRRPETTNTELVTLDQDAGIAYVTLNRPQAQNLITHAMMNRLCEALEASSSADVLVLRSSSDDFTLGRDQSERPSGISARDNLGLILEANRLLSEFEGVSVACVRGRALGFGSGIALHCDIVVAADTAVFGFDEILHGFPPLVVMTYLGDYLPRKAATDLLLTGRRVAAMEAQTLGMVSRVVADAQLDSAVASLAKQLSGLDAAALRKGKRFLKDVEGVSPQDRPAYGLQELLNWREQAPAVYRKGSQD
jgi:enoyl-CoA hydratase/carnithine racemase